ncbi:hypothetical protein [Candidatus Aquiluna sp. UB-MaderosW2red]|uniref:hypothetical protein n=1 Tax=Candidatus Aquiluna sp. UB-MaderosW2red TaxID=1855377 RepID=UPI000875C9A9|nr:hypothetical protein [Candidatus Aquiluna sp. UB-MaderosW2red]SCX04358.1 hypothetical protein SAMN05216534_0248 [Candidatus Aquiluna sp. UB-MaderosW2red]
MRNQQLFRSFLSFALGIFITFSQSHSAQIGLAALAGYGLALGIVGAVIAMFKRSGLNPLQELPMAVLATLIGLFALLASLNEEAAYPAFISLVTAWGLISGAFELYQTRRLGFKTPKGNEAFISAIFALLLGALFLSVELDVVSAVGFFGAYLTLSGVHLGISAFAPDKAK